MVPRLKRTKLASNRRGNRKRSLITLPELLRRGRMRHDIAVQTELNPLRRRRRIRTVTTRAVTPAVIPNLMTLCNGVCGLLSIVVCTNSIIQLPDAWPVFIAASLVFAGMFFDMMDGQVARKLKQSSLFGTQLDSLSDAVTFGVAPVFLLQAFDGYVPRLALLLIGILHFSCVLLRLARFNVQTDAADSHEFFTGLPSPAAAGVVAAFAIALVAQNRWLEEDVLPWYQQASPYVVNAMMIAVPIIVTIASLLMVSNVCYRHVANQWRKRKMGSYQKTRSVLIVAAAIVCGVLALPIAFCLFAFEAPIAALYNNLRSKKDVPRLALPDGPATNSPDATAASRPSSESNI